MKACRLSGSGSLIANSKVNLLDKLNPTDPEGFWQTHRSESA